MEHIVQFGVSFDDEKIKEVIVNNTQKQLVDLLKTDIIKELGTNSGWEYSGKLRKMIEEEVSHRMDVYKDEIIEMAASKLADRLARTKVVKAMVEDLVK